MDYELQDEIMATRLAFMDYASGMLNCIFKQGQLQRPLSEDEVREACREAHQNVVAMKQRFLEKVDKLPT